MHTWVQGSGADAIGCGHRNTAAKITAGGSGGPRGIHEIGSNGSQDPSR
jgi:hypothetical protein